MRWGCSSSYPPEDVKGFIDNKAENFKCAGLWKVYGDEKRARELFARYKRCTDIYCAALAGRLEHRAARRAGVIKIFESEKGTENDEKDCCDLLERNGQHRGHGQRRRRGHEGRGCGGHAC